MARLVAYEAQPIRRQSGARRGRVSMQPGLDEIDDEITARSKGA